jgi:hypothetical protein
MNKIKSTEPKVLWQLRCKLGEGNFMGQGTQFNLFCRY